LCLAVVFGCGGLAVVRACLVLSAAVGVGVIVIRILGAVVVFAGFGTGVVIVRAITVAVFAAFGALFVAVF